VGKSSLINRLTRSRKLARTSSTPGKTQSINFYRLDGSYYFVDLPGFGYAKAGKGAIRQWQKVIERYFEKRSLIVLTVQLVDSRMPPTNSDLQLYEWLKNLGIEHMLVATKSDKLSNNKKINQSRLISGSFGGQPVVMSSAQTGAGCKEIWKQVMHAITGSSMNP
jgi:GTP-binding protein